MANLLNRMAARAIGAASVAQPLVPARFTPAAGALRGYSPGIGAFEPEIVTMDVKADSVTRTDVSESVRDATLPVERGTFTFRAESRDSPISSTKESVSSTETPAAVENQGHVSMPTATLPITQPAPLPTMVNASAYIPTEVIEPPALGRRARNSAESDDKSPPESVDGEPATVPQTARAARPSPATPGTTRAISASSRPMYSQRDQTCSSESEAPVIRVSIGRIDVRAQYLAAATAPSPARKERPAALSLDEYLKQRSEGKR